MSGPMDGDRLVQSYLSELERALADLPRTRRKEIVEAVAEHIREARARLDTDDEAELRQVLERVGDVQSIRAAAGVASRARVRAIDGYVPWILLFGGLIAGFGWLVGVVLLWTSTTWRTADKILGTVVVPGGLLGLLVVYALPGGVTICSSDPSRASTLCSGGASSGSTTHWTAMALAIVLFAATVATTIHLDRVRRRQASAE